MASASPPISRIRPEVAPYGARRLGWQLDPPGSAPIYFFDATYGGRDEAHAAAAAWWEGRDTAPAADLHHIARVRRSVARPEAWVVTWTEAVATGAVVTDTGTHATETPGPETPRTETPGIDAPSASWQKAVGVEASRRERYPVVEFGSRTEARDAALARLREIQNSLRTRTGARPTDLRLSVEEREARLHRGGALYARAHYEPRRRQGRRVGGYVVRIRRRNNTEVEYFSDRQFGGETGALRAAIYWRDRTLEDAGAPADPYAASSLERSQFGVPRMTVDLIRQRNGSYYPYLRAQWPGAEGRTCTASVNLTQASLEEALDQLCQRLVAARRASTLTRDAVGHRASPFDLIGGWFDMPPDLSPAEEAATLHRAIAPYVEAPARAVLERWRLMQNGIPGLRAVIRQGPADRWGVVLSIPSPDPQPPSADTEAADTEPAETEPEETEATETADSQSSDATERVEVVVRDDDVEEALETLVRTVIEENAGSTAPGHRETMLLRLARRLEALRAARRGRDVPGEDRPGSITAEDDRPERWIRDVTAIGLPSAQQAYREARQGIPGLRLVRNGPEAPAARTYTLFLSWSGPSGTRRRQRSFDAPSDLLDACQRLFRKVLGSFAADESTPHTPALLQDVLPIDDLSPEALDRLSAWLAARARPALEMQLQTIHETGDRQGPTASGGGAAAEDPTAPAGGSTVDAEPHPDTDGRS